MSGREGAVHLLAADGLLTERYRGRAHYLTLCAEVITESDLPHATCPDEACDCELYYCPECIRWALGWNAEADSDAAGNRVAVANTGPYRHGG